MVGFVVGIGSTSLAASAKPVAMSGNHGFGLEKSLRDCQWTVGDAIHPNLLEYSKVRGKKSIELACREW